MNRSKGGVRFNWKRINKHIQPVGLSSKLSLFLGLRCKPMKKVIGYHPDWEKDITDKKIGNEPKDLENWNPDIYIEAIPETLSDEEINNNQLKMALQWKYAP